MKTLIHYGCGLDAPDQWQNFDASPTLRIQKIPIIGSLVKNFLNVTFPDNVLYGDIVKGLPLAQNSCDIIYCSHVLEHLALDDFREALRNTHSILKPGGVFRLVVPDLESLILKYNSDKNNNNSDASVTFMENSLLGTKTRTKGLKGTITTLYGNSNHLWMWDYSSLQNELRNCGFTDIKRVNFGDSGHNELSLVENKERFVDAVAISCTKT